MMEEQPRLLVTFETAAPLFQHVLAESLKAAGFSVEVGVPTVEQRGAGGETVEALIIDIEIQGEGTDHRIRVALRDQSRLHRAQWRKAPPPPRPDQG